jgi:chemotaxis methyl-accepting protein methylase
MRAPDGHDADGPEDAPVGPAEFGRGELAPRDAAEFRGLKRMIQARAGLCCDGYKERVLRRRIAVRMRAKNVKTFGAYAALLKRDPTEYQRLLDTVTINVSKFFRNASTWVLLRDVVIPELWNSSHERVRIWSAGSAAGEEAYSIVILLLQHAEGSGQGIDRFDILATDIDSDALEQARRAEYGAFAFTEMAEATRDRWFEGEKKNLLRDEVKQHVRFEKLDLMLGEFPADQHLILCRNVLIYFERTVQHAMFRKFHEATAADGFLQLGKVETLFGAPPGLYETVSARERLFRKA